MTKPKVLPPIRLFFHPLTLLGSPTGLEVGVFTGPICLDYAHPTCFGVNKIGIVAFPKLKN